MALMCCNGLKNVKLKTKAVKVGIFGLDNAGKTTATKAIIGESLETVAPTVGYSSYKKKIMQYEITFYDLGGGRRVRDIWKHYLAEVHGLIFVVDSTEVDRLTECKEELQKLLSNSKVQGKPILLLANKQDKGNALDDKEIVSRINLEDLVTQNKCHCRLELCSAHVGIGSKIDPPIRAGLKWLLRIIDVLRETAGLEERVLMDTEEAQRIEREQAKQKRLQVQKAREERLKAEKNAGKQEDDSDKIPLDPFKPVQQAVLEAEQAALSANKNVVQPQNTQNKDNFPSDLIQPFSLITANEIIPKLDNLKLQSSEEQSNSKESSPHSNDHSEATTSEQSARRRRRRPRPNNGKSALDVDNDSNTKEEVPVPHASKQSPTQNRNWTLATDDNGNNERSSHASVMPENLLSAPPIAASLRLSGPSGSVEQHNNTALSSAFVREGGPNVTSSDAFI